MGDNQNRRVHWVLWIMVAAVLATQSASSQPQQQTPRGIVINNSSIEQVIDVSGARVVINGSGCDLVLKGSVTNLVVNGSDNRIEVDTVERIVLSGAANEVTFGIGSPSVVDNGQDNLVQRWAE